MPHVIVRETVRVAGYRQMLIKGALVPDDAPIVKAHGSLFATPEEFAAAEERPQSTEQLGGRAASTRTQRGPAAETEQPAAPSVVLEETPQVFPCPKAAEKGCSDTFETEAGAKIHAARAHR